MRESEGKQIQLKTDLVLTEREILQLYLPGIIPSKNVWKSPADGYSLCAPPKCITCTYILS